MNACNLAITRAELDMHVISIVLPFAGMERLNKEMTAVAKICFEEIIIPTQEKSCEIAIHTIDFAAACMTLY